MKDIQYIVWDWNGTLIDDVTCAVESMITLMKENNVNPLIDEKSYKETFGFPVVDYYRKIGFDVESESFSKVAERFIQLYNLHYRKCSLHEGAIDTMNQLHGRGFKQIILSASERNNLLKQVADYSIDGYLDEILGIDNIYAGSKEYLATNWIHENHINPGQVLFVGDTTHDYEVASRNGCHCLLISKGHQSKEVLERLKVDIVGHHREILPYLGIKGL